VTAVKKLFARTSQLMKKPVIATNVGGIPELMKNIKTKIN